MHQFYTVKKSAVKKGEGGRVIKKLYFCESNACIDKDNDKQSEPREKLRKIKKDKQVVAGAKKRQ